MAETGQGRAAAADGAIERAKRELQQMIDLNPEVMLLVDRDGVVARANRALLELVGIPDFAGVLGRPIGSLFQCRDSGFFARLLAAGSGYRVEETTVMLGGEAERILRFTVVGSGGDGALAVVVVSDLTAEKALARKQEKEHKKEAVGALMGALMHTINQPLAVIMMRAQLAQLDMQRGAMNIAEIRNTLKDIVSLTEEVEEILRGIEQPADYVTEQYLLGVEILDIKRSGGEKISSGIGLLDALVEACNAHIPDFVSHSHRVGNYAELLAKKMGLDSDTVGVVKRTAIFHDIGKIGIRDAILRKTTALTAEETDVMMRHAEMGHGLLRHLPFLDAEAQGVLAHHERYDGQGYPRRLAGEAIPLSARITAVADAFEVMRSGREYQSGRDLATTVAEIQWCAGSQFDPAICALLYKNATELDGLCRR